jgi:hypothetical protein
MAASGFPQILLVVLLQSCLPVILLQAFSGNCVIPLLPDSIITIILTYSIITNILRSVQKITVLYCAQALE